VAEIAALKYRAFLSYSHHDTWWAKWLHGGLESFSIDKDWVGRDTAVGRVPKTLRPIFRDREDFSGGHSLTDATIAALDASAALIVLCSTVSAGRPAVNEEVRLFRSRHPDRPVIPVIVEGTWPENFPPALRNELATDGTITDRPITILGPDVRESGDGKNLGLAKVVAGLTGIGTDDVFRRAERERRRKARFRNAVIAVLALLALAATASAVYAWQQLKTNELFLNAILKQATEIVNEAVAQAEKYNVPRAATLALLGKAEGLFDDMARYGRPTPELRYRKGQMLIQFARNYAILGDTNKQRERANEAYRLLVGLATEKPDDTDYQGGLALAYIEIGDVQVTQGDLADALKSYRDTLAVYDRLAQSDPANARWQRDLSVSYHRVGDVQVAQGDLASALRSYREGLTIAEPLAKSDPSNHVWQGELSVLYDRIGDVQVKQGDLAIALKSYRDSLAIDDRLAKSDPSNTGWQSNLALSYDHVGNVQLDQGDLAGALKSYSDSLAILDQLTKSDPSNTGWQNNLSVAFNRVGDVQVAQGDLAGALKSYRDSLAIKDHLAKSDPSNADWQHHLSVSYNHVGDVQVKQGDPDGGLKYYRDGLAIAVRLAQSDPSNAGWQRDLSVSYARIGDVQFKQRDLAGALKSYSDSLAIAERLTQSDPSNAGWQNDLATSLLRVGGMEIAQGDRAGGLKYFRDVLAIKDHLAKSDPSNAVWQREKSNFVDHMGKLAFIFVLQGDFASALDASDQVIAVAPSVTRFYTNRAHALMFLGRLDEARAIYLQYRGTKNVQGEKPWETVVLEEFAELRKWKLDQPLMGEIEQKFRQ
jgi:tetratricopeptide (TPR) repeat protein